MKRRWLAVAIGGAAVVTVAALGTTMLLSTGSSQPVAHSATGPLVNTPDTTTSSSSVPTPTTTRPMLPTSSPRGVPPSPPRIRNPGMPSTTQAAATPSTPGVVVGKSTRQVVLGTMPTGSVTFSRNPAGRLFAEVAVFGLTPGSAHAVQIDSANGSVAVFDSLRANDLGQAVATLGSSATAALPHGSTFAIRLGPPTAKSDPVAGEVIARTATLAADPAGRRYPLLAVDVTSNGTSAGTLSGQATLTYDPAAHTLTVTLTAGGLTPGPHAVHVHVGSCARQGAPKYMPPNDFVADQRGLIVNRTEVISNVPSNPLVAGFYLNLHQGDRTTILRNNAPAPGFRPLLCADI